MVEWKIKIDCSFDDNDDDGDDYNTDDIVDKRLNDVEFFFHPLTMMIERVLEFLYGDVRQHAEGVDFVFYVELISER